MTTEKTTQLFTCAQLDNLTITLWERFFVWMFGKKLYIDEYGHMYRIYKGVIYVSEHRRQR